MAVLLEMRERTFGCVDRYVSEVGASQALKLGVEVREIASWSRGSLEKSIPGGTFWVMKATCSVSAKKLSGMRSITSRPAGIGGKTSSGMIFVGSSTSKSKESANS
jgi:hypothetical protein